jgi:long-chain acyl-CoA synthetase
METCRGSSPSSLRVKIGSKKQMTRTNLNSLAEAFSRFRSDAAVVETRGYRRHALTYAELHAAAENWSAVLEKEGIAAGDRVLLWGANSAEWVSAFWGVLLRGAVAVPMDAGASLDFVQRTVAQSGVKLILRESGGEEISGNVRTLWLSERRSIEAPRSGERRSDGGGCSVGREAIAEILFTSGTTAEPRGVVLTHGNFLANLEPIERAMLPYLKYEKWLHPLRFVSLVPLSHVFGQFMGLFVPPLFGATVVFENSANPADIVRTLKREKATVLIAVPRMLDLVRVQMEREVDARGWRKWLDRNYEAASGEPFLRRAWRFRRIHRLLGYRFWAFISGGAALGATTELFIKRLGFAVVQGYGMTETASLISLNHPFSAREGSVGKILPGREFKLAEDGEILVRGENVSSGYWENGELREGTEGGWLRTGDLGELDANGNLKFRGRKKNVIVTAAGLNIYPEDLEGALKKQPAIRDAVVVAIEKGGNADACAVLLKNTGVADDGAWSAVVAANASLAEYQQIRNWKVWPDPDFPRTPTGKPRLAVMAEWAAGGKIDGNDEAARKASAARSDPIARFLSEGSLNSLSSLDRVALLSELEQRYNIEINETDFSQATSAVELSRLVEKAGAEELKGSGSRASRYQYPRWAQWEPIRWLRLLVYYLLVWPATQILAHPRIVGRENLRGLRGPVIVVSNHITRRADMGLILAALPIRFRRRLATAIGGETLLRMRTPMREWHFAKRWAYQLGYWLVTLLFNVFPLPQFSGFRQSFRFAGESADRGYSVLIFPEGEVNNSEDGRMAPFRPGIGLLAENLGLPVVPMRLDGVWQMKRERRRLAHLGEITVRIGAPITFVDGTPPAEIAQRLETIVKAL